MMNALNDWSSLWPGLGARFMTASCLLALCWSALYWAIH